MRIRTAPTASQKCYSLSVDPTFAYASIQLLQADKLILCARATTSRRHCRVPRQSERVASAIPVQRGNGHLSINFNMCEEPTTTLHLSNLSIISINAPYHTLLGAVARFELLTTNNTCVVPAWSSNVRTLFFRSLQNTFTTNRVTTQNNHKKH